MPLPVFVLHACKLWQQGFGFHPYLLTEGTNGIWRAGPARAAVPVCGLREITSEQACGRERAQFFSFLLLPSPSKNHGFNDGEVQWCDEGRRGGSERSRAELRRGKIGVNAREHT